MSVFFIGTRIVGSVIYSARGAIRRSVLGLLGHWGGTGTPWDQTNWESSTDLGITLAPGYVEFNKTYVTVSGSFVELLSAVERQEMLWQVVTAILSHETTNPVHWGCIIGAGAGDNSQVLFRNQNVGGAVTDERLRLTEPALAEVNALLATNYNTQYRMAVWRDAENYGGRELSGGITLGPRARTMLNTGRPGMYLQNGDQSAAGAPNPINTFYRLYEGIQCRSRYIRVESEIGDSVEVLNNADAVLASANFAAGVATIDMLNVALPGPTKMRMKLGTEILHVLTPSDGVWPGDVYIPD